MVYSLRECNIRGRLTTSGNQRQTTPDFGEHCTSALKIHAFVRSRHDGAKPRLPFGNCRKSYSGCVEAGIIEASRKLKCLSSFANMNRSNRSLAQPRRKTDLFESSLKKPGVRPKFFDQFFSLGRIEKRDCSLAGCYDGR